MKIYPAIDINNTIADKSDIALIEGTNAWHFDHDTIMDYSKLLGVDNG